MVAEGQTRGETTAGDAMPPAGAAPPEPAASEPAESAMRRLALLQRVASGLASTRDAAEVAEALVTLVRPALGARLVSLRLLTAAGTLDLVPLREDAGGVSRLPTVPLDADYPSADAVRRRQPVWLRSPEEASERYPGAAPHGAELGIVAGATLPLCAGDRCLGSLGLFFDEPRDFDEEDRGLIESIAVHCAQALERARLFDAERRARRLAEETSAELESIVGNAPLGVAFLDTAMRYRRVNRVLTELNGLPVEAHLGRTPREIFAGLPVDALEQQFREVLSTGVPLVDVEVAGEGPAMPGRRRVTLASWYPVRVGGEPHGVGVLVREVTAEREAQEFQRHVLGVVSHDLRSPLSAIRGCAALLRARVAGERELELVARIESSARRMQEIIQTLLDYTCAREGRGFPLERRPCDVAELCRAIALECEAAHPGREVRCSGSAPAPCTCDPGRVGQMLGNVIVNALQHGAPEAPVEVRWSAGRDEVVLEVSNRGPPIPAGVLAHLFEPFERGGARHGAGLGLGLFIARGIALAHGGRIDVRSSAEEGTVFTMAIPRDAAPP